MPGLEEIYSSHPFRTRNADEYELENILDLFVDPTDGLNRPFVLSFLLIECWENLEIEYDEFTSMGLCDWIN